MRPRAFGAWRSVLLLAIVGGSGFGLATSSSEPTIPPILLGDAAQGGSPVWVAAEAAAVNGQLRMEIFGDASRRNVQEEINAIARARERRPSDRPAAGQLLPAMARAPYLSESLCESSTIIFDHPDVPRNSFEALHQYARDIVVGRIVAIDQGFVSGTPSSLLKVEIESVLRSSGDFAASRSLYVVYPYAVFRIGTTTFCRKEPAAPYRPQIEDRVLLLPASMPIDEHDLLAWPEPEEVIAEKTGSELVVARSLQEQEPFTNLGSLDELIERLQVQLEQGGENGS